MSELFAFYKDLLSSNGYQINRGYVQTGQTTSWNSTRMWTVLWKATSTPMGFRDRISRFGSTFTQPPERSDQGEYRFQDSGIRRAQSAGAVTHVSHGVGQHRVGTGRGPLMLRAVHDPGVASAVSRREHGDYDLAGSCGRELPDVFISGRDGRISSRSLRSASHSVSTRMYGAWP